MNRYYHNGKIWKLAPNEIFVFGSNEAGIHGAGAALTAKQLFGAEQGKGVGMTGQCYAFPTKDKHIKTMPLDQIQWYAQRFNDYAGTQPDKMFLLTAVGCGLAGYKPEDIAPMFQRAPYNVVLPLEFKS